jgi:hypothetical protein
MGYRIGETVIVTTENVNHVAVILDKYQHNKQTMYDVLLENRRAIIALNTSMAKNNYINKILTTKLCDTDMIQTTIPYKTLLEENKLPSCRD